MHHRKQLKHVLVMTTYYNNGTLYYVYFVWQDGELWRYPSWAQAKKENKGKPIYLCARLHSMTYSSDELINSIGFTQKPKIREIKRFMEQILSDSELQSHKVSYKEWEKYFYEK